MYKLAISATQEKRKAAKLFRKFCVCFIILLKNSFCKTRAKLVSKENVLVNKIINASASIILTITITRGHSRVLNSPER